MSTQHLVGTALDRAVEAVRAGWPDHGKFLDRSLASNSEPVRQQLAKTAELVERLVDQNFGRLLPGYRWMCEMVLGEEIEFRRTGHYRYSSFEDANRAVYQNDEVMSKYMDGLLLSQLMWSNHAATFQFYVDEFLAGNKAGYRHLEVGPGHGLLLFQAARDQRCASVAALDISPTSLAHTKECLRRFGTDRPVTLLHRSVTDDAETGEYDSIVLSEILEHIERPLDVLKSLRNNMAPGGRLFVNVPVNSPAVDHIYLLRQPEEAVALVRDAGFEIAATLFAPVSGYSLERARKSQVSISVAVVGTR